MTSPAKNLLLLRLDALHHDVTKVDAAVARAEQRGQYLRDAYDQLKLHIGKLRTVENTLSALVNVMKDDPTDVENLGPKIRALLEDAAVNLSNQLDQAEPLTKDVLAAISRTLHSLNLAMATTVSLKDPEKLKASLNRRCRDLKKELQELRSTVAEESTTATRPHWETYQKLLDEKARPIFVEYVDFLGGLTVRDTGLDDLVCEMTEALLLRYNSLTKRSLPLPGRQAALGNALESVVLLGFPEWSIWASRWSATRSGSPTPRSRRRADSLRSSIASRRSPAGSTMRLLAEITGRTRVPARSWSSSCSRTSSRPIRWACPTRVQRCCCG